MGHDIATFLDQRAGRIARPARELARTGFRERINPDTAYFLFELGDEAVLDCIDARFRGDLELQRKEGINAHPVNLAGAAAYYYFLYGKDALVKLVTRVRHDALRKRVACCAHHTCGAAELIHGELRSANGLLPDDPERFAETYTAEMAEATEGLVRYAGKLGPECNLLQAPGHSTNLIYLVGTRTLRTGDEWGLPPGFCISYYYLGGDAGHGEAVLSTKIKLSPKGLGHRLSPDLPIILVPVGEVDSEHCTPAIMYQQALALRATLPEHAQAAAHIQPISWSSSRRELVWSD